VRSSYSMDEWTPPPPPDLTQPQPHSVRLGCLSLWSLRHQ
jgi:hypothetical protein